MNQPTALTQEKDIQIETFLADVQAEVRRATVKHAPLNSHHEAYSVILEELDEYKTEVWKQTKARDPEAMRVELKQLGAMACRAAVDLGLVALPASSPQASQSMTAFAGTLPQEYQILVTQRDAAATTDGVIYTDSAEVERAAWLLTRTLQDEARLDCLGVFDRISGDGYDLKSAYGEPAQLSVVITLVCR